MIYSLVGDFFQAIMLFCFAILIASSHFDCNKSTCPNIMLLNDLFTCKTIQKHDFAQQAIGLARGILMPQANVKTYFAYGDISTFLYIVLPKMIFHIVFWICMHVLRYYYLGCIC